LSLSPSSAAAAIDALRAFADAFVVGKERKKDG
jgi:hypothetical protein